MSTEQTVNTTNNDRRSFINQLGMASLALGAGALLSGEASAQTVSSGGLIVSASSIAQAFKYIQIDEANHVAFLTAAIQSVGGTPRPKPTFQLPIMNGPASSATVFVQLAAALENTGTGAYLAATPLTVVTSQPIGLQAAAEIALVEGRHAGFLNALLGRPLLTDPGSSDTVQPSPNVEVAQNPDAVYTRAAAFIGTVTDGQPASVNLNGGTPLPQDATIGSASYVDILNYALFLEYLEAQFYANNVPHFFRK